MTFIVLLLLLTSFRWIPNQCYKHPKIGKPFPELAEFLKLLAFHFEKDVFVEFAFDDTSLYASYSETLLYFVQQHSEIIALHFNVDDRPLEVFSELIIHTDSLDVLM